MSPTQAYIESLISIQLAYINTNHPDFIGGSAAVALLQRKHEKRRREAERSRKRQDLNVALGAMKSKDADTKKEESMISPDQTAARPIHREHALSDPNNMTRDGGFLTYFFGGHHPTNSGSPDLAIPAHSRSRSSSPTRMLDDVSLDQMTLRDGDPYATQHHSRSPEREEIEVELIRSLIHSYFNITRKSIGDLVPKTIMHLIVNYARENIQNRLVSSLYREDLFAELLAEDEHIMNERAKCKTLLDTYRKGAAVLQDIF